MEDNIFGLKFDNRLGNAEIMYDIPDYRDIPEINMDEFIFEKANIPDLEMLVDV